MRKDKYEDWTQHLESIIKSATFHIRTKYGLGQVRHGGKMWRKPLLVNMLEEQIDGVVYCLTIMEQHSEAKVRMLKGIAILNAAVREKSWHSAQVALSELAKAVNILKDGNKEGETEEERIPAVLETTREKPGPKLRSKNHEKEKVL